MHPGEPGAPSVAVVVEEPSQVGEVRRAVAALSGSLGFDETEAVTPLPAELRPGEAPSVEETYPFGL